MSELPTRRELQREVRCIEELGTLPHVMLQIQEAASSDRAGARELGETIAQDQSLTAKVLKVANSAFYGSYGGVGNISQAVVLLGFEEIKRLALGISVVSMFETGTARSNRRLAFWEHCFRTAVLAELIDRDRGSSNEGAFTSGLLHDLGRVVLDQYFPVVFRIIHENQEATSRLPVVVEQELLGCTHGTIGFWVAERWRFPPTLAESIRFHHQPSSSLGAARLTAIVHLADALVHRGTAGTEGNRPIPEIHPAALAELDLVPSAVDRYLDAVAQSREVGDALVRSLMQSAA